MRRSRNLEGGRGAKARAEVQSARAAPKASGGGANEVRTGLQDPRDASASLWQAHSTLNVISAGSWGSL